MPRRNQRAEHVPLSALPDIVVPTPPPERRWLSQREWDEEQDRRWRRTRERNERREKQRVIEALADHWETCIVPGCERESILKRWYGWETKPSDPNEALPLCLTHATVVWRQVQAVNGDPTVIETTHMLREKARARQSEEHEKAKVAKLADLNGDIYFVRVGDLIKVGWSREVWNRVKSYGASAEVLCCYPGTRNDETNLHRQLRPALAKGREWYHDGPVIQMFLEQAHRHPDSYVFEVDWTEPKDTIAGNRRTTRR